MKKKKIFGVCAVATIAALSLASCHNDDESNKYRFDEMIDTRENVDIDMNTKVTSDRSLSSISADTTNLKTHYYIGESFDATGLVVKANYVEFVDGSAVPSSEIITGYYYSLDEVDFSKVGTYPVNITYRTGATIKKTIFNINVTTSELDDLNVEYLVGIEPTDSIISINKNSKLILSEKNFKMHYFNAGKETKLLDMTSEEYELLTIDTSNVKTNKTGQYVVSYYYNASVVDKENKIHNYKLTGFIVVNVK